MRKIDFEYYMEKSKEQLASDLVTRDLQKKLREEMAVATIKEIAILFGLALLFCGGLMSLVILFSGDICKQL